MKPYYLTGILSLMSLVVSSQTIFGKWIMANENGIETSIVEIYEKDEKVYGKIVNIIANEDKDALCEKCTGEEYNQPILGLEIIKGLEFDGTYYRNGSLFSPQKGKSYKCRLSLDKDNPNILEVRAYVAFIYETQYWRRVE